MQFKSLALSEPDIYLKTSRDLIQPPDAQLLVSYRVRLGLSSDARHVVSITGRNGSYQIWQTTWFSDETLRGRLCSIVVSDGGDAPLADLTELLIRSRWPYEFPQEIVEPGLISADLWDRTRFAIRAEVDRIAVDTLAEEDRNSTAIITTAKRLGLSPRPSGEAPGYWNANCPGTNHTLSILSPAGTWGCGYCRGKGGPDDLDAFVRERQAQRRATA